MTEENNEGWREYPEEKRVIAHRIIGDRAVPCEVSELRMGDLFVFRHADGYDMDYMHRPLLPGEVLIADVDAKKNLELGNGYYIICHHVSLKDYA